MPDAPLPQAPPPPSAPIKPEFSLWDLFAEFVGEIPVVGKPLKLLLQRKQARLLFVFLLLVWVFVIYPLLVPVIAAALINKGGLFGLHNEYAAQVRSAFRVKEATDEVNRQLNSRLDYFYAIEFVSDPRDSRNYEIPVSPSQRVVLRVDKAQLRSRAPGEKCPVPASFTREGAQLMTVEAGGQAMLKVTNQGARAGFELTGDAWKKLPPTAVKDRLSLTFEPVPELQKTKCLGLELEVRATVEVFKEML